MDCHFPPAVENGKYKNTDELMQFVFLLGMKFKSGDLNLEDQMVEAMKNRGVVVEYLVKDNEGHGFRNEENRFEFYKAMEVFLNENMGASAN